MTTKQTRSKGNQRPKEKIRCGRFSLTFWPQKRVLCSGNPEDTGYIERQVEMTRVCLQYSVKNRHTGKWLNQQIWFNLEDLSDLRELLGELSSSSFLEGASPEGIQKARYRVYQFIQALKANMVELPFDSHDLAEKGVRGVLREMGWSEIPGEFEADLLRSELVRMARQAEIAEVARANSNQPLQLLLGKRRNFGVFAAPIIDQVPKYRKIRKKRQPTQLSVPPDCH